MTTLREVLRAGRGAAFIPLVYKYSLTISGVPEESFEKSSGRAISIYKSYKFCGYDGMVNDFNPRIASLLAAREFSVEQVGLIPEVSVAVDTTKRIAQMRGDAQGDILGIVFAAGYAVTNQKKLDLDVFQDNLANLGGLYCEAGCTGIMVIDRDTGMKELASYRTLVNAVKAHDCHASILWTSGAIQGAGMVATEMGFSFVGSSGGPSIEAPNPCVVIDPDPEGRRKGIQARMELGGVRPVLVTMKDPARELPGATLVSLTEEVKSSA